MDIKKKLTVSAVFAGAAIGTMHIANRIFSYIATVDKRLEEIPYEYYEWRFGKIAYTKKGSGTPLLLVHNLDACSSSYEWKYIEGKLSKSYTVYSIDLLGCGKSERSVLTYTNYLYVQLLTDFIKHVIGQKTDVIVSGESSSFVLMACSNDESIINRIILINPQNMVNLAKIPTKRSKMIKHLICLPVIGTFIYNIKVNKKTIRELFETSYYYDTNEIKEQDILTCFEASHLDKTHSKYLYACVKSRFTNANVAYCLKKLNNSIFIITGNANPENILSANQYQNYLPSIEIIGIENTKQVPHMEKPEEFIEQVKYLFTSEEI